MARNYQKQKRDATLYWGISALMLLTAPPIGIILIAAKMWETRKDGKAQAAPETPLGARTTGGARPRTRTTNALAPLVKKAKGRVSRGSVLTALTGLALAGSVGGALGSLSGDLLGFLQSIWFPLCCTASSGAYLLSGLKLRKRVGRYRTYLSMIGHRRTMSVPTLAAASNIPVDQVREDLEEMLDSGLFTEGFLDYQQDQLILSDQGLRDEAPKAAQPQPKREDPAQRENAILAEIRQVNDLVKNEKVSAQIDQVGMLTARILDYEKSHPQSAPQLHSFLSYYLPTTLKILRAYGQLEAQEVSGSNITAAMRRIEDMMDKVVAGFEKQLDQLFLGETMDITSDVAVLEQMLAKDGLSGQGFTLTL